MHKICPCQSCGRTATCVSHDTLRFYCNRCLPMFTRQNFYWMDKEPQQKEEIKSSIADNPISQVSIKTNGKTTRVKDGK